MSIRITCPECGKAYQVPESAAGKRITCKACGSSLSVHNGRLQANPSAHEHTSATGTSATDSLVSLAAAARQPLTGPRKVPTRKSQHGNPAVVIAAISGIVIVLVIIAVGVYFGVIRDSWESTNRDALLSLKADADDLLKRGSPERAKEKYNKLFQTVGDHQLRDLGLQEQLHEAHESAQRAANAIESNNLARQEAVRRQQDEDKRLEQESQKEKAAQLYQQGVELGQRVPPDYDSAFRRFTEASSLGSADAMAALAGCYYMGFGTEKNDKRAVTYYRKAADLGNTVAMTSLGNCYCGGVGVAQDYAEGMKWYKRAAGGGNTDAMVAMGNLYKSGLGVAKDEAEANRWYDKAAAAGNKNFNREVPREALQQTEMAFDPATSFKAFVPKFLAEFQKINSGEQKDAQYDLRKTDSLLSPMLGVITLKHYSHAGNPIFHDYTLTFVPKGDKWVIQHETIILDCYNSRSQTYDGGGMSGDEKATEDAQK